MIIALARGNVYGEDSPCAAYEHAGTALRSIFSFVDIDVQVIVAEDLGRGEDARRGSVDGAVAQAREMPQTYFAVAV